MKFKTLGGKSKATPVGDRFDAIPIPQLSQHCTNWQSAAVEYYQSWGTLDIGAKLLLVPSLKPTYGSSRDPEYSHGLRYSIELILKDFQFVSRFLL